MNTKTKTKTKTTKIAIKKIKVSAGKYKRSVRTEIKKEALGDGKIEIYRGNNGELSGFIHYRPKSDAEIKEEKKALRKRGGKVKPTRGTLDFETDPFLEGREPEAFAVGIYTDDFYWYHWGADCAERAGDFVRYKKLNLYAHNGGKFDFFYMLRDLEPELLLINGRIAQCNIGETVLKDSYLMIPNPLSAYKKEEIDYDIFEKGERDKKENKREILAYLKSDCVHLHKLVGDFIDRFGEKLTVGQAAFSELEKTGYPTQLRTGEVYDAQMREFYYGGRCEAFEGGVIGGDTYIYDINSAYPYAMTYEHPVGTRRYLTSPDVLPKIKHVGAYFATVLAVSKGALPYRTQSGEIIYPTDDVVREYSVTGWEIEAGVATDTLTITSIIQVIMWDEHMSMKPYVDKFYKEKLAAKKAGDKTSGNFAKLMLTSAYGKFGSDPRKYKEYRLCDWDELPFSEADEIASGLEVDEYMNDEGWTMESDTAHGKTIWSRPDPGTKFFNVAVAASITGHVRAYLWRSICASEGVYYCDTDSIICAGFIDSKITPVGDGLGQWDFEGHTKKLYIGGKKLYTCRLDYCEIRYFTKGPKKGQIITDKNEGEVKKAHKGARLTHGQIVEIVTKGKSIVYHSQSPIYSLTSGVRFMPRTIKSTYDRSNFYAEKST